MRHDTFPQRVDQPGLHLFAVDDEAYLARGLGETEVANVFLAFFGQFHDGHFGQDGDAAVAFHHADERFDAARAVTETAAELAAAA